MAPRAQPPQAGTSSHVCVWFTHHSHRGCPKGQVLRGTNAGLTELGRRDPRLSGMINGRTLHNLTSCSSGAAQVVHCNECGPPSLGPCCSMPVEGGRGNMGAGVSWSNKMFPCFGDGSWHFVDDTTVSLLRSRQPCKLYILGLQGTCAGERRSKLHHHAAPVVRRHGDAVPPSVGHGPPPRSAPPVCRLRHLQ